MRGGRGKIEEEEEAAERSTRPLGSESSKRRGERTQRGKYQRNPSIVRVGVVAIKDPIVIKCRMIQHIIDKPLLEEEEG